MSRMPATPIHWDTLARYRLIEILALWEGRVTALQLAEAFGIGRQQAQKVLRDYRALLPHNLDYNTSLKGFLPTTEFQPRYTKGRVEEYLQLQSLHDSLDSPFAGLGGQGMNTEALPMPSRAMSPAVVRALVKAARAKHRLEVVYASFSCPAGEERIIVPHTLVFAAERWHVRAYCEKRRSFRDFVLSRFGNVPEDCGKMLGEHDEASDDQWQTQVEVCLIADRRLSPQERQLVARDYGMHDGALRLNVRGPLVLYALRQLGINPGHLEGDPRAQQIEIANRDVLKKWIDWN